RDGHHETEAAHGPLLILELTAVREEHAGWQVDALRDCLLCLLGESAEVATSHVRLDDDQALSALTAHLDRTGLEANVGELGERNTSAARGRNGDRADRLDRRAERRRILDHHVE